MPVEAHSLVLLAYQFGGSRNHPRCLKAARIIRNHGFATLLCDLPTNDEEAWDEVTGNYHNDAEFLAKRLVAVTGWAKTQEDTRRLRLAYYGVSAGAGAAIIAAARLGPEIHAVVSRDGRLDLPAEAISQVKCPTLLVAGENDENGLAGVRRALEKLACPKELKVIPGASCSFGEPGKHEEVVELSAVWLHRQLKD